MRGISYLSDQVPEEDVRRDLTVIRDELHCDCVLVKGSDATRQLEAAEIALALGLEVWIEAQRENARPRAALAPSRGGGGRGGAAARGPPGAGDARRRLRAVTAHARHRPGAGHVRAPDAHPARRPLAAPSHHPPAGAAARRRSLRRAPAVQRPGDLRRRAVGARRLVGLRRRRGEPVPDRRRHGRVRRARARAGRRARTSRS